jgi:hypothetical protein
MSEKAPKSKRQAKPRPAERSGPNEGEGSQTGAREYNKATRAFVGSGKVQKAAEDAKKAIEGKEAGSLKRAEAEGKRHSHGEDPALYQSGRSR